MAASNMPRVLFVSHCSQLSGAELILCDIVNAGFSASTVFLFEDGPLRGHLEGAGLRVTIADHIAGLSRIRRNGSLAVALPLLRVMIRTIMKLARSARTHDLIYANSQKAFVISAFAAAITRRPLVWHLHDIMTQDHFGKKQIWLATRLANAFAARVIVPSQAAAGAFVTAGGHGRKVRVVPNGVSVPADTCQLTRNALRTELGLPGGFLIGVVGRLAPWKGQHVMLDALTTLPDATCIIVGNAMFGEHAYAEKLRRQVDALQLGDRVRFLGYRSDVPRLMRAADIVVHTSVKPEPFGRVLVEAMLCGTPVAASNSGGVPEILGDNADALLYKAGSAADLANLLRGFKADADRAASLAVAGRQRAERLFSVGRMQQRVSSVILGLIVGEP